MDNLTHSLVGLAAAKAGLERLSPGATAVCVLAANAPDADILATLGGRWFYLHHHRGITHSIVGTFIMALLVPGLFWLVDRLLARLRGRKPKVKFRGLLLASLILSASHPILDWTNNYGIRPFLPWSGQWFYGDLVFIVDPYLWLIVGGAAFLLTSGRLWQKIFWAALALLITGFVLFLPLRNAGLHNPTAFRVLWIAGVFGLFITRATKFGRRLGSRTALAALALVVLYWGGLAIAHSSALRRAEAVARKLSEQNGETLGRFAAMPVLADPLTWLCVAETDRASYRYFVVLSGESEPAPPADTFRFEKPLGSEAEVVARAVSDERARILLDFARFPAVNVEGDCVSGLLVQFADLRYTEPRPSQRGSFSLNLPVACDSETEGD